MVSLFGSALHNVRFMSPGTLAVEIHGALKGEIEAISDRMYQGLCEQALGVRWVGYAARGFRQPNGSHPAFRNAFVDPTHFQAFLRRALRAEAELAQLDAEYEAEMRRHPPVARWRNGNPVPTVDVPANDSHKQNGGLAKKEQNRTACVGLLAISCR